MKKRISFNFDGDSTLKIFNMLPIAMDEESKEIINSNGNAEEAYEPMCDKIIDKDGGHLMTFAFALSGCPSHIIVSDEESEDDEYLYEDEDFEITPQRGMMSMEQAEENFTEENYGEEYAEELKAYKRYLTETKPIATNQPIEKGIAQAWEGLADNEVGTDTFIPAVMSASLKADSKTVALLDAETEVHDSTISFDIELQEGEEFDADKLDFINVDTEYDDYSSLFNELLADDIVLMNAIIYDGKIYFASGMQMDFGDNEGDSLYDWVNENMESEKPEVKKKVELKSKKSIADSSSIPEKALSLEEQMTQYPREIQEFINNLVEREIYHLNEYFEEKFKKILNRYPEIEEESACNFANTYIGRKYNENRDDKEAREAPEKMCKSLRDAFEIFLEKKDDKRLIIETLKAKTEFANNKKVQETLQTIESTIESLKQDAENKQVEELTLDTKREKEKARLEAERIKYEIESLKQEKELEALRKTRDAEMKARQEEMRARHEQDMEELKANFKKNKKTIIISVIGFLAFLVISMVLLLLFGPK